MDTGAILQKILETGYFSLPKKHYETPPQFLAAVALERADRWEIPCSHTRYDPALEADLKRLASRLRQVVPASLSSLLRATNGAEFFRLHYQSSVGSDGYYIPRYRVFNCDKTLEVNRELLDVFRSYAESDDRYRKTRRLNYLAYCDVGDGNYLAVNLAGANAGSVFFLDHEYGFYPYSSELATEDAYAHVAGSIDEWLVRLVQTGGWDGLGGRFKPL